MALKSNQVKTSQKQFFKKHFLKTGWQDWFLIFKSKMHNLVSGTFFVLHNPMEMLIGKCDYLMESKKMWCDMKRITLDAVIILCVQKHLI